MPRELIDTGTDKRYVRRDENGQFKESDDATGTSRTTASIFRTGSIQRTSGSLGPVTIASSARMKKAAPTAARSSASTKSSRSIGSQIGYAGTPAHSSCSTQNLERQ